MFASFHLLFNCVVKLLARAANNRRMSGQLPSEIGGWTSMTRLDLGKQVDLERG